MSNLSTWKIGDGRCFVIGEVGMIHDGDPKLAHALIDAIADAGADGVKFQTHIAEAESSPDEPFRVAMPGNDASRFDYWQRTAFAEDQWGELADHAHQRDIAFVSSPFSIEAVDLLTRTGVDILKIASGEVSNTPLLAHAAESGRPVLVSSGMSPMAELDEAVDVVRAAGGDIGLFQCTTAYPCPADRIGVNLISVFRDRYRCPVGLSDHSGTIFPGLAGAALGMDMLEVHVTPSRDIDGPDVPASVTASELETLVDGIRFIETMRANPVDKDAIAEDMREVRDIFTKSIVARVDLAAGTVLDETVLAVRKPGTGIPARRMPEIVGRKLQRGVAAGNRLEDADLEPGT